MSKNRIVIPLAAVALIVSSATFSLQASANTVSSPSSTTTGRSHVRVHGLSVRTAGKNYGSYIFGTVTAISGSSLTINSKDSSNNPVVYTVDASGAKIRKGGTSATSTVDVSAIAVGDGIRIKGTLSGTAISATSIIDGMPHVKNIKKNSR